MKRIAVAVVPLTFVIAASCSESKDRAPGVPTCMGLTCPTGPGPGTSSSTGDAGPDSPDASDAMFEVGEAGVTVSAVVRPLTSFTDDPDKATTFDSVALSVRAPRAGGGTDVVATMPNVEGTFTLTGVLPTIGAHTYFQVWKSDVSRTLAAVIYQPDVTYNLPLFRDDLPLTTWNVVATGITYPTGSSTLVAHVVASGGARLAGVRATPAGNGRGPFYDDGADISPTATATGARGTIVFLGMTGSANFPLTLSTATKNYTAINLSLAGAAVTHVTLQLD